MRGGLEVAGGLLQIAGISCAALGIHKVRSAWTNLPGILGRTTVWLAILGKAVRARLARIIPSFRREVNLVGAATASSGVTTNAVFTVTPPPPPDSTWPGERRMARPPSLAAQIDLGPQARVVQG